MDHQCRKKKSNKTKRNLELYGKFNSKAIRKVEERKLQDLNLKKKVHKDI